MKWIRREFLPGIGFGLWVRIKSQNHCHGAENCQIKDIYLHFPKDA
ncbi:hypothetical protein CIPAW_02G179900 [Carya illinoinensis]|uniref:Uncharacterized protein n=1 Tax=Carya illinoinensis TaxID=32201 RepID=A0A8T1RGG3_CARIL|nr:hypothetical protein CIPAW_02G179900 [Carya illinoinensis]